MPRILLTGASGPIGRALVSSFGPDSQIVCLTRRSTRNDNERTWDPTSPVPPTLVSSFDAVIHLAGESVVGRWTPAKKQAIRESRMVGTRNLVSALLQAPQPPRTFLCASGIGFYGDRADEILTENSTCGAGFTADLARDWEAAARPAATAGIRTVSLRIGLVLSATGGALAKMLLPFKLGLGGRIGSGNQWWSWIHIDDIAGAVHHILRTDSISGPVNLVSPAPAHNAEFTRALAAALHRPAIFPVPAFAARLAFGEMAQDLMLSSQRVEPAKLHSTSYPFRFPDLRQALKNLLP